MASGESLDAGEMVRSGTGAPSRCEIPDAAASSSSLKPAASGASVAIRRRPARTRHRLPIRRHPRRSSATVENSALSSFAASDSHVHRSGSGSASDSSVRRASAVSATFVRVVFVLLFDAVKQRPRRGLRGQRVRPGVHECRMQAEARLGAGKTVRRIAHVQRRGRLEGLPMAGLQADSTRRGAWSGSRSRHRA